MLMNLEYASSSKGCIHCSLHWLHFQVLSWKLFFIMVDLIVFLLQLLHRIDASLIDFIVYTGVYTLGVYKVFGFAVF